MSGWASKANNTKAFYSLPVLTLREIDMLCILEYLTDIPEWWKKVSVSSSYFILSY